jgi:DNA-binding GntR family transcriptional regulator
MTHPNRNQTGRKPRTGSLAAVAYEEIKRRITEGAILPGYPILETELAEALGISRTPVREALMRLKQEELVVSIRRKGIFVSSLSLNDMQEIGDMLEALEGMAVKLAAERATPEDLQRLEETVRAQEEALMRDDIQAWSAADEAFHAAILEAAHNRRIQEAVARVRVHWRRQQKLTIRLRPKPTYSADRHRATLEAIKARNGEQAREIDQRHRGEVNKMLIGILGSIAPGPDISQGNTLAPCQS